MQGSTFNPISIKDFEKSKLSTANTGIIGTALAGQNTNVDFTLTDDCLMTGLQVLAKGSIFGDKITLQVVHPVAGVMSEFGTNINVPEVDEKKIDEKTEYPAKIPAGLIIRLIYTSTGATDVYVAVNYRLHKVLV